MEEETISIVSGNTAGLKKHQLAALERLAGKRVARLRIQGTWY